MYLKLIFSLLLWCLLFKALGQESAGVSAVQRHYNELGYSYLSESDKDKSKIDSAYYFFRKAVYLIDSTNLANNPVTNESLCLLATTYLRTKHFAEGGKIFQQVIKNYQRAGDKKGEADTWYRQGRNLFNLKAEFDTIETSFRKASKLYAETGNTYNRIDTDYDLTNFHFRLDNKRLTPNEMLNTIKISKENGGYKLTEMLLLLAEIKRYAGAFNEALKYAMELLKRVQQTNDTWNANHVYGELALESEEMDEPENSIYWYKKCINDRVKLKFNGYVIYKTAYLMIVQMIKAKKEHEGLVVLQGLNKTNPPVTPTEIAILSQSFAYCYDALGEYAIAEKHFLSMINVFDEIEHNNDVLFTANIDVGKFYVTQQQYTKAEPFLKHALNCTDGPSVSRLKDLYFLMFKVDSAKGDYVSAIEHFQKYKAINDSLFNETKSRQIEELNIQYDVEKKQQNLTILQKENIVQQKGLKQERVIRNFILGGAVLLVLIVALLYSRYNLKQQANQKLEASQEKIEKQNLSLQHLVNEKEWLLKEIHHRVKNNLHTISGLLDAQSGYLQTEEALIAISDSQHRVQAMSLLHQKLFHSENLSTVEMPEYIFELVGYLEHSFGTGQKVRFSLDIDNLKLNLSYALPIGLILNEAITNAIKHAFPAGEGGVITIRLKQQSSKQCLLLIADTGRGLPTNFDSQKSHSMGMNLMRGLSEDINGIFSIKNSSGTVIDISFVFDFSRDMGFSVHELSSSS